MIQVLSKSSWTIFRTIFESLSALGVCYVTIIGGIGQTSMIFEFWLYQTITVGLVLVCFFFFESTGWYEGFEIFTVDIYTIFFRNIRRNLHKFSYTGPLQTSIIFVFFSLHHQSPILWIMLGKCKVGTATHNKRTNSTWHQIFRTWQLATASVLKEGQILTISICILRLWHVFHRLMHTCVLPWLKYLSHITLLR